MYTPHAHAMLHYCMPYSMNMGMYINMALCEKYCRALNLAIFSKKKQILMRIVKSVYNVRCKAQIHQYCGENVYSVVYFVIT